MDALPSQTHAMPVNLYHTDSYLVINASLPRCLPDKVHVSVAPARMLIRAKRHAGEEPIREERAHILSELPDGAVGRVLDLPQRDWSCAAAEAHFANGLLPSPFRRRRGPNICVRCTRYKLQGEVQTVFARVPTE